MNPALIPQPQKLAFDNGRFPLPALRLWALRAMLLRAHLEDEWF
jgi:hypothetical protein